MAEYLDLEAKETSGNTSPDDSSSSKSVEDIFDKVSDDDEPPKKRIKSYSSETTSSSEGEVITDSDSDSDIGDDIKMSLKKLVGVKTVVKLIRNLKPWQQLDAVKYAKKLVEQMVKDLNRIEDVGATEQERLEAIPHHQAASEK